jgi:hypothetical protein
MLFVITRWSGEERESESSIKWSSTYQDVEDVLEIDQAGASAVGRKGSKSSAAQELSARRRKVVVLYLTGAEG